MSTHRRRGFSIQINKPDIQDESAIEHQHYNDLDYNPAQIKRKKSVYNTDYKQSYYICFLYYITLPFAYIYNAFQYNKKKTTHE